MKANIHTMTPKKTESNFSNNIVLHGLPFHYSETENELIDRVSYIFQDILNIDISRYIEEISFIGKRGNIRPLNIELRNKRLRKYILQNSTYFREVGLGVSEYQTNTELRQRRELKKALQDARKNGHHAIIKNNKLIINGREQFGSYHNDEAPNKQNDGSLDRTEFIENLENVNSRGDINKKRPHSKRNQSFR